MQDSSRSVEGEPESLDFSMTLLPHTPEIKQMTIWLRREAEDWYIRERKRFRDSQLLLEPVVLKPICWECSDQFGRSATKKGREITLVLPAKTTPRQLRIYDRSNSVLHMWKPKEPPPEWWLGFNCDSCSEAIEVDDCEGVVAVTEEPFAEYFGLPLDAPKKLRGKAKKEMQARLSELDSCRCFECRKRLRVGKNFTLDHIQPQSLGGQAFAINLQPFCYRCQREKKDLPAKTVTVALDMLLRPPPSDSYEGSIW